MDESEARRKAALIAEYRSQVAHSRRLFRYAARHEPFTVGQVIRGPRSMSRTRPGLHRSARGITIRVPCGDCVVDAGAGDRLRMRFIRAASVEDITGVRGVGPADRTGKPRS